MSERNRDALPLPVSTSEAGGALPSIAPRRRIFDAATLRARADVPRSYTAPRPLLEAEPPDEAAPPSSVDAERAGRGLRPDELRRADAIVRADEESEALAKPEANVESSVDSQKPRIVLPRGREMTLKELSSLVGVAVRDLLSMLVMRGFYALSSSSKLSHESVRIMASMFGWNVEPALAAPIATPIPKKRTRSSPPVRTVAKRRAKVTRAKATPRAKVKSATGRTPARSSRRRSP